MGSRDRSGTLLHHLKAQALGGNLTCIAQNHAADNPFMFATGSHDRAFRVWTKPPDDSAPGNGDVFPHTSSFKLDRHGPEDGLTQQDIESENMHESPQNKTGLPLREQMVSFAADPSSNV